jgi:hypothetical protein
MPGAELIPDVLPNDSSNDRDHDGARNWSPWELANLMDGEYHFPAAAAISGHGDAPNFQL